MKTPPSEKLFRGEEGKCQPGGKRKPSKLGCHLGGSDEARGKPHPSGRKHCKSGNKLAEEQCRKSINKGKTKTSLTGVNGGSKRQASLAGASAGKLVARTPSMKQAVPKKKNLRASLSDKKQAKKLRKTAGKNGQKNIGGVIYIGHLPLGFMEPQLRGFFCQFGEVTRVRLFRSRKNNHSKGYALVEFAVAEVARIAAEAMDKYRMFGRTLVCRVIPREEVSEAAFRELPKNAWAKRLQRSAARHDSAAQRPPTARALLAKIRKFDKTKKAFSSLGIEVDSAPLQSIVEAPQRMAALRRTVLSEKATRRRKREKAKRTRKFVLKYLKRVRGSDRQRHESKQTV